MLRVLPWLSVALVLLAVAPARACLYDLRLLDPGAERIEIAFDCPATTPLSFAFTYEETYRHLELLRDADDARVTVRDGEFVLAPREGRVRGRYGLALHALANAMRDNDTARRHGASVLAPAASWLLRPGGEDTELAIAVAAPAGGEFVTGMPFRDGRYRIRSHVVQWAGYSAFGRLEVREIALPGPPVAADSAGDAGDAVLRVALLDGPFAVTPAVLFDWVADSARIHAEYWGGFPLREAAAFLLPTPGRDDLVFGRQMGIGGGSLITLVGSRADRDRLYGGWHLIHELNHLGHPMIAGRHGWLMEGIATYTEPVLRARAGWNTREQLWDEFVRAMPRGVYGLAGVGLARAGSRYAYWGGALFMLLADIDLRRRSGGRLGLEDCLQGVVAAGGASTSYWSLDRYVAACDAATGIDTFARLRALYVDGTDDVDLEAIWRDLGVRRDDGRIRFDDAAPLAAIRRAIESGRKIPLTQ